MWWHKTPVSHAAWVEISTQHNEEEEDLEDIGDGVDGDGTFPRWDEYFAEVFDDDEIGNAFTASDDDPTYHGWEFEPVPQSTQTPYPEFDSVSFLQENRISGIRALKAPSPRYLVHELMRSIKCQPSSSFAVNVTALIK
ncbi:hypothetical protein GQ600_14603 [Phytophthora cactorum]|nr:hypothetical protein GQ600_14603 [Phytophthora cactorum]